MFFCGIEISASSVQAEDVLSMMKVNGFPIDDGVLQEVRFRPVSGGGFRRPWTGEVEESRGRMLPRPGDVT